MHHLIYIWTYGFVVLYMYLIIYLVLSLKTNNREPSILSVRTEKTTEGGNIFLLGGMSDLSSVILLDSSICGKRVYGHIYSTFYSKMVK